MAKHADGPISGRMIFTENPMRMSAEGGMTLKSGDETIAEYTKDAWMRSDNVRPGFLPGRVERKKHRCERRGNGGTSTGERRTSAKFLHHLHRHVSPVFCLPGGDEQMFGEE
jgi:hypothetical protein